jgi:cell division protein ZapA
MSQVVVTIAGRTYRMNCDEGEEAHIERLALSLDAKIAELRSSFGEIGDQRIIVMAALTLADESFTAQKKLGERDESLERARAQAEREETRRREWALDAAAAMNEASERIEAATKALNQGRG